MVTLVMDELDVLAAQAFEGYVVRKDLARSFKGRYPVPEYVAEFLLVLQLQIVFRGIGQP